MAIYNIYPYHMSHFLLSQILPNISSGFPFIINIINIIIESFLHWHFPRIILVPDAVPLHVEKETYKVNCLRGRFSIYICFPNEIPTVSGRFLKLG